MRVLIAVLLSACAVGCVDSEPETTQPDAGTDRIGVVREVPPDACSREPSGDCCDLLPDTDAVRKCSYDGLCGGVCGVVVCWSAACEQTKINFCVP